MKSDKKVVEIAVLPIRTRIRELYSLKATIKQLEEQEDKLAEGIVKELGIKGVLQFGTIRCTVVQQWRRTVPWGDIAKGLARKYLSALELRKWGRSIGRKYPKKATKAFVKLTDVVEEER